MASTEAQKKATVKYMKENLEDIRFRVPKGNKEKIRSHAESKGMSLTAYIKHQIDTDMNKEN